MVPWVLRIAATHPCLSRTQLQTSIADVVLATAPSAFSPLGPPSVEPPRPLPPRRKLSNRESVKKRRTLAPAVSRAV